MAQNTTLLTSLNKKGKSTYMASYNIKKTYQKINHTCPNTAKR